MIDNFNFENCFSASKEGLWTFCIPRHSQDGRTCPETNSGLWILKSYTSIFWHSIKINAIQNLLDVVPDLN